MTEANEHTLALIASGAGSIAASSAWLTWFVSQQFSKMRKLMHDELALRDKQILRIQMFLIRRSPDFQPGIPTAPEVQNGPSWPL